MRLSNIRRICLFFFFRFGFAIIIISIFDRCTLWKYNIYFLGKRAVARAAARKNLVTPVDIFLFIWFSLSLFLLFFNPFCYFAPLYIYIYIRIPKTFRIQVRLGKPPSTRHVPPVVVCIMQNSPTGAIPYSWLPLRRNFRPVRHPYY